MTSKKERFVEVRKRSGAVAALVLLIGGSAAVQLVPRSEAKETEVGKVKMENGNPKIEMRNAKLEALTEEQTTTQSKFYCNIKALNPAERTSHKQLTDKLMALRRETVESEQGYEFQYSPKEVSLSELAEWVAAEGKCCPFFDFHIDLENERGLLCLRLTGGEGIKEFLRAELQILGKAR